MHALIPWAVGRWLGGGSPLECRLRGFRREPAIDTSPRMGCGWGQTPMESGGGGSCDGEGARAWKKRRRSRKRRPSSYPSRRNARITASGSYAHRRGSVHRGPRQRGGWRGVFRSRRGEGGGAARRWNRSIARLFARARGIANPLPRVPVWVHHHQGALRRDPDTCFAQYTGTDAANARLPTCGCIWKKADDFRWGTFGGSQKHRIFIA